MIVTTHFRVGAERRRLPTALLLAVRVMVLAALGTVPVLAQCSLGAVPGPGVAGVSGSVGCVERWDPDGTGPLGERIVVGGTFDRVGSQAISDNALWDPATGRWSALGLNEPITDAVVLTDGRLVVYRRGLRNLTVSTGSGWQVIGTVSFGDEVEGMTPLANGGVAIVGTFTSVDSVPANGVAVWDGATWSARGAGFAVARAVVEDANGDLVVVGAASLGMQRWNGAWWAQFTPPFDAPADALVRLPNGDLVAGGFFGMAGNVVARSVARWDGQQWQAMDGGTNGFVTRFHLEPGGALLAMGRFTEAGTSGARYLARWDGNAWTRPAANLDDQVEDVASFGAGELFVGGQFFGTFTQPMRGVAHWDGAQWNTLGEGSLTAPVRTIVAQRGGGFVAAGNFDWAGDGRARKVARYGGGQWSALGAGFNGQVNDLIELPDGRILAGGRFTTADGASAIGVAQWDGTAWSSLGAGVPQTADLALAPNGDVYVAANTVWRWDGSIWQQLPGLLFAESVLVLQNGEVWVGGEALGAVHRWNGATWGIVGGGIYGGIGVTRARTHAMLELPNGNVLAGGTFGIRQWDGSSWSTPGGGLPEWVYDLAAMPNGDVVAAGNFRILHRWDGSTWTALLPAANQYDQFLAVAVGADGVLAAGGSFTNLVDNDYFLRLESTCPATTVSSAPGCPGPGMPTLTANLPWLGSAWIATATSVPANSLVFAATGFGAVQQPLQPLIAQALPGCELRVTLDAVGTIFTTTGTAVSTLTIPNDPGFVGQVLHHQMIPWQLDSGGALLTVTATNALTLTIGSL